MARRVSLLLLVTVVAIAGPSVALGKGWRHDNGSVGPGMCA